MSTLAIVEAFAHLPDPDEEPDNGTIKPCV